VEVISFPVTNSIIGVYFVFLFFCKYWVTNCDLPPYLKKKLGYKNSVFLNDGLYTTYFWRQYTDFQRIGKPTNNRKCHTTYWRGALVAILYDEVCQWLATICGSPLVLQFLPWIELTAMIWLKYCCKCFVVTQHIFMAIYNF
jgi:hypothetical protein